MTEPDKENVTDEVDEGNEQTLSTENSIDVQVKPPTVTQKGIQNEVCCFWKKTSEVYTLTSNITKSYFRYVIYRKVYWVF